MRLRTDDDIYRARLVYLGPPGYTLPFQMPYAQWGLGAAIAAVLVFLGAVLTGGNWMSCGVAFAAAVFMTNYIWQHVDPDRPARKVLMAALTDRRRIRPQPETLPRLSARHIRFSTLDTGDQE